MKLTKVSLQNVLKSKLFWGLLIGLLVEIVIVVVVFNSLKENENKDIDIFVEKQGKSIITEYELVLGNIEHLISRNSKIFQLGGKKVKLDDFVIFIDEESLSNSVSIRYQRWFPRIALNERADFEEFGNLYIQDNYTILDAVQIFPTLIFEPAANRSEYFPFALSVPQVSFRVGGDLITSSSENNFDIELAISNNVPTTSRRTRLFELNSILNYAIRIRDPVYELNSTNFTRDDLLGITETLIIPNNIFTIIIDGISIERNNVDIFMYDLSDTIPSNESLIFREDKNDYVDYNSRDAINSVKKLDNSYYIIRPLINRDYFIQFTFKESYVDNERTFFPEGILITLIIIFIALNSISVIIYKTYNLKLLNNTVNMQYNIMNKVNHNMRNPLNIIKGNIELLIFDLSNLIGLDANLTIDRKKYDKISDEELTMTRYKIRDEYIHPLIDSYYQTINLNNIIHSSDYVNLSIVNDKSSIKATPALVNIEDIINVVKEIMIVDIEENHNIKYDINVFDGQFKLYVNLDAVKQILVIFLKNAFQYTDNGSVILDVKLDNDSNAIFSIIDTGKGVDESIKKSIFDAKEQKAHVIGSGGLGTYHAALIAKSIDSNVGYEPTDNGSKFWLTVPVIKQIEVIDI